MPIPHYGVLAGRTFDRISATSHDEHYHMLLNHGNIPQRVSINTQSATPPSQVLYYANTDFRHPITNAILHANLPLDFLPLHSKPGGLALDFVRSGLFDPSELIPLPGVDSGNHQDLNDKLDSLVQLAIDDDSAMLYAFGQHWLDTAGTDVYFPEIAPSRGIHDIHMNQGNPHGPYYADNGPYQDGGLLFHFPGEDTWAAVFIAFQSQSFSIKRAPR